MSDQKSVDQDLVKLLDDARTKINALEQALDIAIEALKIIYHKCASDEPIAWNTATEALEKIKAIKEAE